MPTICGKATKVLKSLVYFVSLSSLGCSTDDFTRASSTARSAAGDARLVTASSNARSAAGDARLVTASSNARSILAKLRAEFCSKAFPSHDPRAARAFEILGPSPVEHIVRDGDELLPRLTAKDAPWRATVALPTRAHGAFRLREQAGMTVEIALSEATDSAAEADDGLVIYPHGHKSGADILHRPIPDGTEDYLYFERAPSREELEYEVSLGEGVAGVRLVANTLELLDHGGAPRLRMAPPYAIDAVGAKHAARVRLWGCAYDADTRAPWGREVTEPGARRCTVHIDWSDAHVAYPALLDPLWNATGNMAVGRIWHTASVLANGRVLVAGGYGSGFDVETLASAELYDPATDTFGATGDLIASRGFHTESVLADGRVLITGGELGYKGEERFVSAEVYDPVTGSFNPTGEMVEARSKHTASVLADGKVLIVGGARREDSDDRSFTLASAEVYDPSTGSFSLTGRMAEARLNHTASVLADGTVLVTGGLKDNEVLQSAELYDPLQKNFTVVGEMSSGREQHTASVLLDGKVLVVGAGRTDAAEIIDNDALMNAELYDPATRRFQSTGRMLYPHHRHTASVLPDGEVLIVGGVRKIDGNFTKSVEMYDPYTGHFFPLADTRSAYFAHTASTLACGEVLITGGSDSATSPNTELFNPNWMGKKDCIPRSFVASGNGCLCHAASTTSVAPRSAAFVVAAALGTLLLRRRRGSRVSH